MPISRYGGITGSKKISEDFDNINTAFNNVATEADANKATVDGHIANGNLHTTLAEKTKLAGITTGAGGAGSASDTVIGNRTIADTTAPTGDTGTITTLLGWLANMIKAITGKSSWRTAPATTLEAANTHMNNSDMHTSAAEHTKLAGIQAGAEVNQKAFSQVNNIPAGDKSDTLTVTGGTGITVTNNPATKTMIVTATGTAAPGAHASSHLTGGSDPIPVATTTAPGLMSADDRKRMDTEATTAVILSAGQQILNATKNARLQGLKVQGRTLIDLLGGAGSGESLTGWSLAGSTLPAISTAQKKSGASSFKMASGSTGGSYMTRDFSVQIDKALQYVFGVWVFIESYTAGAPTIALYDMGTNTIRYSTSPNTSIVGSWQFVPLKLPVNNSLVGNGLRIVVGYGSAGASTVYYDELRLYAVSATDYAAIGTTITGAAIDALLPYVPPGINGVDGLWVRRYGRNLLPSVPDSLHANAKMNGPYDMTLTAQGIYNTSYIDFPVIPGQKYTFSMDTVDAGAYADGGFFGSDGQNIMQSFLPMTGGSINIGPAPANAIKIRVYLSNEINGVYRFKNWQLELGNVATPFQPREDSPISFGGVELHANPNDGSDPDILREVNGRYEVTRLWRKSNLVGDWSWLFDTNYTGFKRVRVILPTSSGINASERVTKYNGYPLYPSAGVYSAADQSTLYNGVLYITIAITDSGWGDSYTPTSDEIKAYFNGWRMYNGASGVATNPYNGTAGQTKGWVEILSAGNPVGVLPTTIPSGWTPYQLLYRLATPTTETVQEDGALSLLEGDNFIELGSGYISREPARPKKNALSDVYYIGLNDAGNGGDSSLKKRASEIKQVFKNSLPDFWNIDKLADGTRYAWTDNYDTATSYSVSYIKLDKSPVPSVSGAYAATEKMQIHDLTDAVTEISSTVSVLAAKKAEKDAGPWITPSAVLSGFTAFDLAYRVNKGFIEFRGYVYYNITDVPAGTKIFNLPTQFRPVRITRMLTSSWTSKVDPTSSAVSVGVNGDITTEVNAKQNIIFDGLRFPLD
ncbi:hypothetical protein [Paenibacillus sp. FSL L8-0708]|uniref:hypothetical protein n=1 Tax=Paenibacillus sp. FSL L8-0708 TaxID=2975311 RepID=UPI0030FA1DA1